MWNTGHPSKYRENFPLSNVADVTITRRPPLRLLTASRSNANNTSVATVRSCASSSIITEYRPMSGSTSTSRSNMPSVMYLITVLLLVQSSNRIWYPTSWPRGHPTSSATRCATLLAATRLGCVHAIIPWAPYPSSAKYWVICVDLPDPVSPTTTSMLFSATCRISCDRTLKIGRDSLCCRMLLRVGNPHCCRDDSVFHWSTALGVFLKSFVLSLRFFVLSFELSFRSFVLSFNLSSIFSIPIGSSSSSPLSLSRRLRSAARRFSAFSFLVSARKRDPFSASLCNDSSDTRTAFSGSFCPVCPLSSPALPARNGGSSSFNWISTSCPSSSSVPSELSSSTSA